MFIPRLIHRALQSFITKNVLFRSPFIRSTVCSRDARLIKSSKRCLPSVLSSCLVNWTFLQFFLNLQGPSGVGKSTILKKLFADFEGKFGFSVSHTSRQPREGEVDTVDYHFSSKEAMTAAVERGEFIESATFG